MTRREKLDYIAACVETAREEEFLMDEWDKWRSEGGICPKDIPNKSFVRENLLNAARAAFRLAREL